MIEVPDAIQDSHTTCVPVLNVIGNYDLCLKNEFQGQVANLNIGALQSALSDEREKMKQIIREKDMLQSRNKEYAKVMKLMQEDMKVAVRNEKREIQDILVSEVRKLCSFEVMLSQKDEEMRTLRRELEDCRNQLQNQFRRTSEYEELIAHNKEFEHLREEKKALELKYVNTKEKLIINDSLNGIRNNPAITRMAINRASKANL